MPIDPRITKATRTFFSIFNLDVQLIFKTFGFDLQMHFNKF